jgi:hypothetical protein
MSPPDVLIAIPCHAHFELEFGVSLSALMHHAGKRGYDVQTKVVRSSLLPQAREELVEYAYTVMADHILWLDADMRFPPDTLERLLAHEQEFVCANALKKAFPYIPAAQIGLRPCWTLPDSTGLEEVDCMGLAVALTEVALFARLEPPWFQIEWNGQSWVGEDGYFCSRVKMAGGSIYVDHDLSKQVGHIGSRVFTFQDAWG